jgi:2-methylisocitrate lyase-like PEP mutase family enzyme
MIKRALDAGAHGIMIPLLSNAKEVEEVVQQVFPFVNVLIHSRNFLPKGNEG